MINLEQIMSNAYEGWDIETMPPKKKEKKKEKSVIK